MGKYETKKNLLKGENYEKISLALSFSHSFLIKS